MSKALMLKIAWLAPSHHFPCNPWFVIRSPSTEGFFFHPQVVRSLTSTPEASPVHRPAKDTSVNISFGASLPGDKNPAPSTSSGGFTSWFPGMRSTNAQSSSDRTSAVVGPTKSSATEELVSDNFTNRKICEDLRVLPWRSELHTNT